MSRYAIEGRVVSCTAEGDETLRIVRDITVRIVKVYGPDGGELRTSGEDHALAPSPGQTLVVDVRGNDVAQALWKSDSVRVEFTFDHSPIRALHVETLEPV